MRCKPSLVSGLVWRCGIAASLFVTAIALRGDVPVWCAEPIVAPPPPNPEPLPGCASPDSSGGPGSRPTTGADGAGSLCPKPPCTGSPCYVGSGAYGDAVTDLAIPTIGLPLEVHRLYNSARVVDGALGPGWTSNMVSRLYYATYLFAAPSTYQKEAVVAMPSGVTYRFTESTGGSFTAPAGRRDLLVRNPDGTFVLTLEHSRSKLKFASDGSISSLEDDYGNALAVTYDGSGRVQRISDQAGSGRFLTVTWAPNGRIGSIQDSGGRLVQFDYFADGTLRTVTNPANLATSYFYNPGRFVPLLSQIKDHWNRIVTEITYDPQDRVHTYTESGETYTYSYGYQGNPNWTGKTDSLGRTTTFAFVPEGYITDQIPSAGAGGPLHRTIRSDGLIEEIVDQVGIKTRFAYDSQGRVASVTKNYQGPAAVRFDYSYDPAFPSAVLAVTPMNPSTGLKNLDWQGWQYDYYQAGSPAPGALFHVYRIRSNGTTRDTLATYVYNAKGQVTRHTNAVGASTDYGYDTAGNLVSVTAPANNDAGTRPVTAYAVDPLGRLTSLTDPLGRVTSYAYDALDRLLTVTLPKPTLSSPLNFRTMYTYDDFEAVSDLLFVQVTDANGYTSRQGYDEFGQLVQNIDSQGNVTQYAYTRGLLTSITDPNGNATSYGYDAARRLSTDTRPDGSLVSYGYTDDGLLSTVDRGPSMLYEYDAFKRLVRRSYPGSSQDYTFVGQKLTGIVDTTVQPAASYAFAYDSAYRLSSDTQAGRGTLAYTYTAADAVASYSVSGGPAATLTYYPNGALNSIVWSPVAGQFKYRYRMTGQSESVTFPNGQTRNYLYDDQGRLTQLSNVHPGAGNLATFAYGYDLNHSTSAYNRLGQRVSMTATVPSQGLNGHLTKYEYDTVYQLTKATYPSVAPFNGEVHSWTYDAIGNRLTNKVNATTQTYAYQRIGANQNNWQRLLNDGQNAYTYDMNGNTLTRNGPGGNFTFAWDLENRIYGITGAVTASYLHDHQGRRVSKTVGSATTTFLYDGLNLIRESGASAADYLFGPGIDEPLAMSRGGQIYYPAVDALGSIQLVTNASGSVQNKYLYDVWGLTRTQTGTLANPFGYTGREFGEAATLFYRARYYQPSIGRFLSEDPLIAELRTDAPVSRLYFYAYASNSPLDTRDPLGLKPCGPEPAYTGTLCAGDCHAKWSWWLCNVRNANEGAGEIQTTVGAGDAAKGKLDCGLLLGAPIKAAPAVQAASNVAQVAEGYRRCLNFCQEKQCMGRPLSDPPPLCRRGYPFFKHPILPQ